MRPTYAKNICTLHKTIHQIANVFYSAVVEHSNANIMSASECKDCRTDNEDVFKFISFAAPLLLFVVGLYQPCKRAVFLVARKNKSEAISHEMTPVRGEGSAS